MTDFFKNNVSSLSCKSLISKLLIAITAVSFFETAFSAYTFNSADFFNSVSFPLHILAMALVFIILILFLNNKYDGYFLIVLLTLLFTVTNFGTKNIYFALVSSAVTGGFIFYFGKNISFHSLSKKTSVCLCIVAGSFLALFIGSITIVLFLANRTPNFDFGIFSQMFHYMKNTLIPYTTCERDMLLSHFAVHFSPILYIVLPFYLIFPHPSTILAFQAVIVALGVIPLYKLSKHFGLSNNKTLALVFMYVLHPTVIANNFYYFHENCFLTFLLLFMFYFAEKNKTALTLVFALLTMAVKEDAPVYVLFFGLYLLFSNKSKLKGFLLCGMSSLYFTVVTKLMSVYGQGIMSYRYNNFIFNEGDSIYTVIINIIKNPSYLFEQLLKAEKLQFLIVMLVPLAFLPFAIKKPSRIILLFPMILINLMTQYVYQYNIGFQYTYATVAFLFYLTVINVSELSHEYAKKLLMCGMCASLIFFSSVNLYRLQAFETYASEKQECEIISKALDLIPKDKSIKSTSFFIPALWNRNEVYEYAYSDKQTDYVVFDIRWSNDDLNSFIDKNPYNYELFYMKDDLIAIYKAKQ